MKFIYRFSQKPVVSAVTKMLPIEAPLTHAERRTDTNKAIRAFCEDGNAPKSKTWGVGDTGNEPKKEENVKILK